jgi:hypothetical protein
VPSTKIVSLNPCYAILQVALNGGANDTRAWVLMKRDVVRYEDIQLLGEYAFRLRTYGGFLGEKTVVREM